jgi:BarA-like signal transduction histidine kinase
MLTKAPSHGDLYEFVYEIVLLLFALIFRNNPTVQRDTPARDGE